MSFTCGQIEHPLREPEQRRTLLVFVKQDLPHLQVIRGNGAHDTPRISSVLLK
jgi:hypothetical protein